MSRNKNVDGALRRARRARERMAPVVAKARPVASQAGVAAKRGVRRTRVWAAPQVRRAGEALQDRVAPKVSAMMSSAAERIDPDRQPRERTRRPAGRATAAVGAVRAFLRKRTRRSPAQSPAPSPAQSAGGPDEAAEDRASTSAA